MTQRSNDVDADRYAPNAAWATWAVFSSLALHGIAYGTLSDEVLAKRPPPPKSVVAFEVTSPPPVPELPTPEPAPREPEPAATRPVAERPRADPPPPRTEPTPTAPSNEVLDMSGLTLTNDQGAGFAMPIGNGLARDGALRMPASLGREAPRLDPAPPRPAAGPVLVAVSDLSSRPMPPALDGALERNYPNEARRRGVGGNATVRLRIDPDGIVRIVTPLDESAPGFGEACRRTVRGSRWSAPRDREGRSVATEVRYTCRFVVNR